MIKHILPLTKKTHLNWFNQFRSVSGDIWNPWPFGPSSGFCDISPTHRSLGIIHISPFILLWLWCRFIMVITTLNLLLAHTNGDLWSYDVHLYVQMKQNFVPEHKRNSNFSQRLQVWRQTMTLLSADVERHYIHFGFNWSTLSSQKLKQKPII